MHRRQFLVAALASLAAASAVAGALEASMKAGPPMAGPGHHRLKGVAAGAPPLDGFTMPSGAYSFRKLRTAYAGSAVKLQRVDLATQDIGFTATGDFNTAAATAFCTTACTVTTWYDQSGFGRDLVQATAGNQPAYVAACNGALPCAQTTATVQIMASAGTITPATGLVSFSVVAKRAVGTAICFWIRENGAANRFQAQNVANTWALNATGNIAPAATDNVWHSAQGVIAGASSVANIDGVETTGTITGSVAAGVVQMLGTTGSTCQQSEMVFWDNYQQTSAERTALRANQQGYYGTP